jgi:hypothetical protein
VKRFLARRQEREAERLAEAAGRQIEEATRKMRSAKPEMLQLGIRFLPLPAKLAWQKDTKIGVMKKKKAIINNKVSPVTASEKPFTISLDRENPQLCRQPSAGSGSASQSCPKFGLTGKFPAASALTRSFSSRERSVSASRVIFAVGVVSVGLLVCIATFESFNRCCSAENITWTQSYDFDLQRN